MPFYDLEKYGDFEKDYLLWFARFIKYKAMTLSGRYIEDSLYVLSIAKKLDDEKNHNAENLTNIAKELRNSGVKGISTYFYPILSLFEYLVAYGIKSIKEISEDILAEYFFISLQKYSVATRNNHKNAILLFLKFIETQNRTYLFRVELKTAMVKKTNSIPYYLQDTEIEKFLNEIDNEAKTTITAIRDRAILKMILYTGARVNEIILLKHNDILTIEKDEEVFYLKLHGKGDKMRIVPIARHIIENELSCWLSCAIKCEKQLVFCNKNKKILTQGYLSRVVDNVLRKSGIRKRKNGTHLLRHTYATRLYKEFKDLVLVQEILGHSSLNTSRIYTHYDKDKLRIAAGVFDEFCKKQE